MYVYIYKHIYKLILTYINKLFILKNVLNSSCADTMENKQMIMFFDLQC